MKRREKFILLAFAVLDVLVIGTLGFMIWQTPPAASIDQPSYTPCAEFLMGQLPTHLSPTTSWETNRLNVRMTAYYDIPTPPAGSAQLLWEALDALSQVTNVGCPLPPEIVITVTAQGTEETTGHIAKLTGTDLSAWINGQIEEDVLVKRAAYRVSSPEPRESPPAPARYPQ